MATVVGILDRDSWSGRTDNIVVADPVSKTLTWIPRDLWCDALHDRVSEAFVLAGFAGLFHALRDVGFACDHGLVLRRGATERAAARISVKVPVDEPLDFLYPLAPTQPIERGHKRISFRPPEELLEGERIHQWIGARITENQTRSDLDRIKRQQVFLRALLQQQFDFKSLLADADLVRVSDDAALSELASIEASWRMTALDNLRFANVDGKSVLKTPDQTGKQSAAGAPQLAAVVVASGAPSVAIEAVRSLLAQELPVEVLVVNSGGGDMGRLLAQHGVNAEVLEREEILSSGAAKNLGIRATRAPLVAFLTADCSVRPDWSRRRVFVHQAGLPAIGSTLANAHPQNPIAWAAHFATWARGVRSPLRGGLSYERSIFDTHGFFREDLCAGEEREFLKRLPAALRPDLRVKIRAYRRNPTRFSGLIADQFQRGTHAALVRCQSGRSSCGPGAWLFAMGRAANALGNAKKNRGVILRSLPLVPIALATHCLGVGYGWLQRKIGRRR